MDDGLQPADPESETPPRRRLIEGTEPSPADIALATGSAYCYGYKELPRQASVTQIRDYCSTTRRLFAPIAQEFDEDANSRWALRHYLAIKFATAANLLAGSAEYAYDHNLLLGIPYFCYYTALNACRAYLLTSPHVIWKGAQTIEMTHQNILNRTTDYIRALDAERAPTWGGQLNLLRDRRELYSYRFPLSGADLVGKEAFEPEPAIALARLIAELASLNSECLDASLRKHASEEIPIRELSDHEWASAYELAGVQTRDRKDYDRFSKLVRQWKTAAPLEVMCSDGLMDDVYSAWIDGDDRYDVFDPDKCHHLVLAL